MKKNLLLVAIAIVAAAVALLGAWQALGLGSADDGIVAAGAMGWLALALVGFGTLAAADPFAAPRA